jgi:hypothetical protein
MTVMGLATAVQVTHDDATRAVAAIARAHQGTSTQVMLGGWERLSAAHVSEIVDGCGTLADALDAAAAYIVAQKTAAIAVLVEMAAAFVADQAASLVTFGIAEVAVPLIVEGAEKLVDSLIMDLQQYLIGEVIEAAAKPLIAMVAGALSGLDWSQSGASAAGTGTGFTIDPPAVRAQTDALRGYSAGWASYRWRRSPTGPGTRSLSDIRRTVSLTTLPTPAGTGSPSPWPTGGFANSPQATRP